MAISGSFKQPCPSCEASVPIKDASLIGKKVDCPKCKYRFVVEAPKKGGSGGKAKAEEAVIEDDMVEVEEIAAKPRGAGKAKSKPVREEEIDDEPATPKRKGKKATANNTKLLVGLGLAGLGVVALAVAAFFLLFSGGPDNKKVASNAPNPMPKNINQPDDAEDPQPDLKGKGKGAADKGKAKKGKDDKAPAKGNKGLPETPPASTGRPAGVENTNFLPPSSEVVYHAHFKDFLDGPLGKATVFEPAGPLKDADFRKQLGFSVLAVDDILTAESFSENWTFHVVHTTQVVNDMRPLIQALGLKPWKDASTQYTCYEVSPASAAYLLTLA